MRAEDSTRELIDAVLYGDLFDCAVTLDEACNFSRRETNPNELTALLGRLVADRVVGEHNGFYFLPGREALALKRPDRIARAQRLRRRAVRVARWLRHVPFVRGIYLTGSVAANHAEPDADVDLLFLVADNRLASAFAQLGPAARLLSRQVLCPNYYLSEVHLQLKRRSHYIAREVAQARPLLGRDNPLISANPWVREFLPNVQSYAGEGGPLPGSLLQRCLEWPLRGRLGDRLEAWLSKLVRRRLTVHHEERGSEVPAEVLQQFEEAQSLRFHASERIDAIGSEHEKRHRALASSVAHHPRVTSTEVA